MVRFGLDVVNGAIIGDGTEKVSKTRIILREEHLGSECSVIFLEEGEEEIMHKGPNMTSCFRYLSENGLNDNYWQKQTTIEAAA